MINTRIPLVDLKFTQVGDLSIKQGDLEDTSRVPGLAFRQEVRNRISSAIGSWKTAPRIGSNIDTFEGLPNNADTGAKLENDAANALTKDGFLNRNDFHVKAIPVSQIAILLRIQFRGILTDQLPDSTIVFSIIHDLSGRGPFIVN